MLKRSGGGVGSFGTMLLVRHVNVVSSMSKAGARVGVSLCGFLVAIEKSILMTQAHIVL